MTEDLAVPSLARNYKLIWHQAWTPTFASQAWAEGLCKSAEAVAVSELEVRGVLPLFQGFVGFGVFVYEGAVVAD